MTTPVFSIAPGRPIAEAQEEMKRRDVHHLAVIDEGKVVGVISARDHGDGQLVRDVMATHLVSANPHTTVREAANLLRGRSIGCLPVFDDERLVGIVTTTDLLELIGRGVQKPIAESTRWTSGRRPSRAVRRG